MTRSRLVAFVTVCVAACGGDGPAEPPKPQPTSVIVTPQTAALRAIGDTVRFSARALDNRGADVSGVSFAWTVQETSLASVDAQGLVTALAPGNATVRATVTGTTVSGSAPVAIEPAVAVVRITGRPDSLLIGGTAALTAAVTDANGHPVAGTQVTWTSLDETVATVTSAGVVTARADGRARIRASAAGVAAQDSFPVHRPNLAITRDTALSGTVRVRSLHVPAGVTIAAGGPLTFELRERATILGTITGACHEVRILAGGAVRFDGVIDNVCADTLNFRQAEVRIVAADSLELGGEIRTSGGIYATNDSTLTDADFPPFSLNDIHERGTLESPMGAGPQLRAEKANGGRCVIWLSVSQPKHLPADGAPGADYVFRCQGDVLIDAIIEGASGHAGASMTDVRHNLLAVAQAQDGGSGGSIRIDATGTVQPTLSAKLEAGRGGNGGVAGALGTEPGGTPQRAADAEAYGGNGGDGGVVRIQSRSGLVALGAFAKHGPGGNGGHAHAAGADGAPAGAGQAQAGGRALARGGRGGNSLPFPAPDGGTTIASPGGGGHGNVSGGRGGDGNLAFPDGAAGGDMDAQGGDAGEARNAQHTSFPTGVGGGISFLMGSGGDGFGTCQPPVARGGTGGRGGTLRGAVGAEPSGPSGRTRDVTFSRVANGGRGGDGNQPGTGGAAGPNQVAQPPTNRTDPVLTAGATGQPCAGTTPIQTLVDLRLFQTPGLIPEGRYTRPLVDVGTGQQVGTIPVQTLGPVVQGLNPDHLRLQGSVTAVKFSFGETDIPGASYDVTSLRLCVANMINPLFMDQYGANGTPLQRNTISEPPGGAGCVDRMLRADAAHVVFSPTGTFDIVGLQFSLSPSPLPGGGPRGKR